MRRLRVLHVIGGGDTGGAMSHLLPLLSALERAGCDVHLLCLGAGGLAETAERRGLSVSVLPMRSAHDPRVLGPLRRALARGPTRGLRGGPGPPRDVPWDVVHTHGMRANLPVRVLMPTLRPRPCLFTTVHSDLLLDYRSVLRAQAYRLLDRVTLGEVDTVICVSEALRRHLVAHGYPEHRLLTVHSGLEASGQKPPGRTGSRADVAAGGEERRLRIGTVARLVPVKDIDLLLEAAALLQPRYEELEVVVVGEGPERERLQRLTLERGLAGTVRFTGRVEEITPLLGDLDVYMITSQFEGGVSMAVLEAMAMGVPVVTTGAGGVAEAVVDGETGFVVSGGLERGALAAALAERAATLLDNPALRARMGAAGAQRVRAQFTADKAAARTLRAYERCLAARGRLR